MSDEAALLQVERELCDAYRTADVAAIARLVMEDYTVTTPDGKIATRADDLEDARKHDPAYDVFQSHDMKVRVHGDMAVVIGRVDLKGSSGGKSFQAELQFTDTLVRDHGHWRLEAVHVSKIAPSSVSPTKSP